MRRREFFTLTGGAAAWPLLGLVTALSPPSAFASDYPTRPIHLIVGFTPGASSDIVARLYAKGAGSIVGQEMVVENKTGAGSSIAAGYVAHASDDGYTLLVPALSTLTYKIVHPEVPFDMAKDFAPVAARWSWRSIRNSA